MSMIDFVDDINDQMRQRLDDMRYAPADDFGLDRRAAYRLWAAEEDCIVVHKDEDRTLQYYGGFEYVDKESRAEVGGYVIYFNTDSRVQEHLEFFFDKVTEKE